MGIQTENENKNGGKKERREGEKAGKSPSLEDNHTEQGKNERETVNKGRKEEKKRLTSMENWKSMMMEEVKKKKERRCTSTMESGIQR